MTTKSLEPASAIAPERRVALLLAALLAAVGLVLGAAVAGPADAASAAVSTAKPDNPGKPGGGGSTELIYAAVGDSFAAGTGGGAYLDSSCDRSANAYPKLLDADANLQLAAFPACAGASTTEVVSQQVPAIPRKARVVTVTVGGNDVGFANVMQNCFVFVDNSSCASSIANGAAVATSDGFAASIRNVVDRVQAKAPNAKVIVTGYPLLFHLDSGVNPKYAWADEVNAETVTLNDVIEANAVAAGAVFVDAEGPFAGHGIGSAAPWINDWSWWDTVAGFHPNPAGYVAYANALRTVPVP